MEVEKRFSLFLQLDSEIRRLILLECNFLGLCRYSRTSRQAREEMREDMFWKLKTKKDFGTPEKPPFKGFPDSKFSLKYWCHYNQKSENPKSWRFIYTECRQRLGEKVIDYMQKKFYERVPFLLRAGADPNISFGFKQLHFDCPLLVKASRKGQRDIVLELLRNEVDVDVCDDFGRTALMEASEKGQFAVVATLLKNGADPNVEDLQGQTSLIKATKGCYWGTVGLLLKAGSDPNIEDGSCETALIKAVDLGSSVVVDTLLEAKADPNVKDRYGMFALIEASSNARICITESLLEANADPNVKDLWGQTALERAYDRKHESIVRTLLDYGATDKIRYKFYRRCKIYMRMIWMVIQDINKICERLIGSQDNFLSDTLIFGMILLLEVLFLR